MTGIIGRMERPKNKPADAVETPRGSRRDRALTRNGKVRLRSIDNLDQRTHAARRARELVAELERDLGGDLTTARRELVKRAAMLGAIIEDHEVRWLRREPADLGTYGTLVDRQRRILETLGLDRVARDITPDPLDYARQVAEAQP